MSKLPEWFKLNNYQKNLTLGEWADEIFFRTKFINDGKFDTREQKSKLFKKFAHGELKPIYGQMQRNWPSIATWTLSDGFSIRSLQDIDASLDGAVNDFSKMFHGADISPIIERIKAQKNNLEVMFINFEFSDEEIIKQFSKHLRQLRKNKAKNGELSKPAEACLPEWNELNLLALFDLLYWRATENKKITYTQIGDAIWPHNEIEIHQRVKKVGLPMIMRTFKESVALELMKKSNVAGIEK